MKADDEEPATMSEYEVEVQYHSASGRIAAKISHQLATEARWARWIARREFEESRGEKVHAVNVYRID
jgi:hypothetical protein